MNITVLLFAGLAEAAGTSRLSIHIEPAAQSLTVRLLKNRMIELYPHMARQVSNAFAAVNQSYALDDSIIQETDEIALIPPVSGGEPLNTLTYERISVEEVCSKVADPKYGASIAFVGSTREFTNGQRTIHLEYEAYEPMALKTMEQIGAEIDARWPGAVCAITHRLGLVPLGEISVVITVAAPHRGECYDASRYAIERLKQIVPIWKKEIWEDGSEWKGHQLGPWNPIT